jgi:hypothetical protein
MIIALATIVACQGATFDRLGYQYCTLKTRTGVTTTLMGKVKSTQGGKKSVDHSSKTIRIPVKNVTKRELHKIARDRIQ